MRVKATWKTDPPEDSAFFDLPADEESVCLVIENTWGPFVRSRTLRSFDSRDSRITWTLLADAPDPDADLIAKIQAQVGDSGHSLLSVEDARRVLSVIRQAAAEADR